jgi:outer membrane lipoprotein LolB
MRKNIWACLCFSSIFFLSACATRTASTQTFTPPVANPETSQVVSVEVPSSAPATSPAPAFKAGRFALQIDSEPPQSFITSFDLTGGWPEGALNIYNPLGMQMARLEWTAQSARLLQGRQVREAASLERLVLELTGAKLPTAALVDWLAGKPTPAEGWNVDVSEWHLRRLVLERVQPAPRTVLRIAFES